MILRTATLADVVAIAAVEASCFPPAEAATESQFRARLEVYPNHFWLLEDEQRLIGFVNGMVTDSPVISDAMFANARLHDEHGAWQAIFGVGTLPEYRRRGHAGRLLQHVIDTARAQGRRGLILTCKEALIPYYAKFGFDLNGVSKSVHGGARWHDMTLRFTPPAGTRPRST